MGKASWGVLRTQAKQAIVTPWSSWMDIVPGVPSVLSGGEESPCTMVKEEKSYSSVDVLNTHELYQLCAIGLKNEWCPGEVCQASEMPPEVGDQHTLADRCLWGHMEIVTKG